MQQLLRRLRQAFRFRRFGRDLDEEMRFHLDMKRQEFEAAGLHRSEADAAAKRAMGSLSLAREGARDVWVWPSVQGLTMDFKLSLRMLIKYPGLTLVGGAAMAFGIAAGVAGLEILTQLLDPTLPLDEGHRVVGLRNWDTARDRPSRHSAYDFARWREDLELMDDVGAVALSERNLMADDGAEPVGVAEMTAAGFRIAPTAPLLGRTLVEGDEALNAPPVAVIGEALWRRRFFADPSIVGRNVRLGDERMTIVGVMPESFGFPIAHSFWIPLHRDAFDYGPGEGPSLLIFGHLASDATLEQAQAELTTVGRRRAADSPETHEFLRPQVVPYASLFFEPRDSWRGLALANVFLVALVMLICANVALLIFARDEARRTEIAIRNALGASRRRILLQLFVEALALSGLAAAVGLAAARVALHAFWNMREADSGRPLPFWISDSLTPTTVIYAVVLAVVAAMIIGVVPALNATDRRRQTRLRQSTAGGGGFRFGGVWTAVTVVQVAVTVLFPATAFFFQRWAVEGLTRDVGFRAEEFISARLAMDAESLPRSSKDGAEFDGFRSTYEEFGRRLESEPGVTAVTFTDTLPGTLHVGERYEIEGDPAAHELGRETRVAFVDADFFNALGAPILSGRSFTPADSESGAEVAIVNESFVNRLLQGRNPIGRRIRPAALPNAGPPEPWIEIVGVASDLGMIGSDGVGLYRPLASNPSASVEVAVHIKGPPESFAPRLRSLGSEVDPTLRIHDLMPLDEVGADLWRESQYLSRLLAVLSGLALLLSLTTIYATMAFTVAQRTREIGLRVALGGDRRHVIAVIARRPLTQIGLGIVAGGWLVGLAFIGFFQSAPTFAEAVLIGGYSLLMMGVCLLACVAPTQRALRLQPSEVLRAEG
jgi:predicted permease